VTLRYVFGNRILSLLVILVVQQFIVMHSRDNCATALTTLSKATIIRYSNRVIRLNHDIEIGHKFAITDIPSDALVIKVCGHPQTCEWMQGNIDVDASQIIVKGASVVDVGQDVWQCVRRTCNGQLTAAEQRGHREFDIWQFPHQLHLEFTEIEQRLANLKQPS
jgi:hypothetical protein